MYEKKKTTIILLIVLTLVVCGMIAVNRPILHFPFEEITIHYKTDNGIVSTKLEDNEAATIWWMLNGKPVSWNVTLQGAPAAVSDRNGLLRLETPPIMYPRMIAVCCKRQVPSISIVSAKINGGVFGKFWKPMVQTVVAIKVRAARSRAARLICC